jgi:hypothetical protein
VRICLLVDSGKKIKAWQYAALVELLKDSHTIDLVLECRNTKTARKSIRNLLYFLLALWSRTFIKVLRNRDYTFLLESSTVKLQFDAIEEGSWQKIPLEFQSYWETCDVMIKFGMGLLRDPDALNLKHGVVSFHHGDPRVFRGRPAGFYEISKRERVCGVIVQELSNKLDGGTILAEAYSKVELDSYTRTLKNLYLAGVPLLRKALNRNSQIENNANQKLGKNYRLPNNSLVLLFMVRLFWSKITKILKMLFFRKSWVVAISQKNKESIFEVYETKFVNSHVPSKTEFIADPFWINEKEFVCEGLVKKEEQGKIFLYRENEFIKIDFGEIGHMSYPMVFRYEGRIYILPEMSQIDAQKIFEFDIETLRVTRSAQLQGLEDVRLIDPTIFAHDGKFFLFAGVHDEANNVLRLFTANSLFGQYMEHPKSPIRIDPRGSRMGGPIVVWQNRRFRVGQDFSQKYGNGLLIFEVTELNSGNYSESLVKKIVFDGSYGPHTIDFNHEKVILDRYKERFDPLKVVKFIYEKARFKINENFR